MKLSIVALGSRQPSWIDQGVAEFIKRMPRECAIELQLLDADKKMRNRSAAERKAHEGEKILSKIPERSLLIAMDEHGRQWPTQQWSERLGEWMQYGEQPCFVIGGADGLDSAVLDQAQQKLSLSSMTLPHGLARLVLVEQLYRAWSLLNNHPYHRE